MTLMLHSFAAERWVAPGPEGVDLLSAIDGRIIARASSAAVDFAGMVDHARLIGGPNLRRLTFHDRADLLKLLAVQLNERKETLYQLSYETGATRKDGWIDIDGGIGTLFAYASRGRREGSAEHFLLDGPEERLSKSGGFVGRHILTPRHGVGIHINAFNFPCWGLLEKLAPAILAGVPIITKPATQTAYLAHALFGMIIESGILPEGAVQFIAGGIGDLFDHLTGQDVIVFTGSAAASVALKRHPKIAERAIRFIAERDSLNAAVLGPDAHPGSPEFELYVNEVVREMTVKAGQKCTAIRRALVPRALAPAVLEALHARLGQIVIGDPKDEAVTMGPLVSLSQRRDVRERIGQLRSEAAIVFGDPQTCTPRNADAHKGAFLSPILLVSADGAQARNIHTCEAFGPVATVIAYDDLDQAVELTARGEGSLVASVFTADDEVAETLAFGLAPYHGRLLFVDRHCAAEQTGHGSPLPGLVHGGPGRAGGGEELGGFRGLAPYLQRTALQGSCDRLARLGRSWIKGAGVRSQGPHPFRRAYEALAIGDTVETAPRVITLADIEHFAQFTGDTFYAHMDDEAAAANPFFGGRVAHGYLVLAFAAGQFVDPDPGPVLANYGLDALRFTKPVKPGDAIRVRLTVKQKTPARSADHGEVRWDVEVFNQRDETVARYELLTLNARGA